MSVRRKATGIALVGIAPLALTALTASPAVAHGSMSDPVSRVSACYAEGPESPKSAACKAAVQVGGAQALYDWNGVRDGNAGGKSKERIPDGKLCSAGDDAYKGLDLPRADWPSSAMRAGDHTFRYRATAPHKGSFALYLTKEGYDPAKPLKWSDLEPEPFAKVTDPALKGGEYVFEGKVPQRSGRHLIYSIWQRSDSPEAFYTCSDVVFGKDGAGSGGPAGAPAPAASAPTDRQIAAGADKSSMGAMRPREAKEAEKEAEKPRDTGRDGHEHGHGHEGGSGNAVRPDGAGEPVDGQRLAETGGDTSVAPMAIGGAAVLAAGAAALWVTARRRAARHRG
ncbi:putative chitin-binding protein [Streptomyces sp. NBRC 110611]|uniref:lytic polysaccharide monooxygenase auxiliary activity family 9 protein n=1 Tax=Streptomyces sp. NBRC 110611 TaxID=1621259 RepID=UPI000857066D|nr:lytic polysaccharide monooxygenase [Streptomyces sp. NBRC 110611]GAU66294.1 putative chitin-binding protein [Streptomyces sp. NBRC 110611]